jgi:hypothetical protein
LAEEWCCWSKLEDSAIVVISQCRRHTGSSITPGVHPSETIAHVDLGLHWVWVGGHSGWECVTGWRCILVVKLVCLYVGPLRLAYGNVIFLKNVSCRCGYPFLAEFLLDAGVEKINYSLPERQIWKWTTLILDARARKQNYARPERRKWTWS